MPFAATLMDLEIIMLSEVSQISSVFYLIQFFSGMTKHFSLTKVLRVKVLVTQSCPTLSHPMDCSPPGSSVHGILQARTLELGAIPFFQTQGLNPGLLHCRQILYCLSHQGSPTEVRAEVKFDNTTPKM